MAFSLFGPAFTFGEHFAAHCALLGQATRELDSELGNLAEAAGHAIHIRELERQAHATFRLIGKELALTLIRPLERADIHELNLAFEAAMKAVAAVAARASMYGFKEMRPAAHSLSGNLIELVSCIAAMQERLGRGESVAAESARVEKLGEEATGFLLVALGELYEDEAAAMANPLEVLRWTHLFERLETAVQRVQSIATILESVVLKQT